MTYKFLYDALFTTVFMVCAMAVLFWAAEIGAARAERYEQAQSQAYMIDPPLLVGMEG